MAGATGRIPNYNHREYSFRTIAISSPLSAQLASYYTLGTGYYNEEARIEDWQIQSLMTWITARKIGLEALRTHLGGVPYGLKLHTALGYGLSPQNIRTNLPPLDQTNQEGLPLNLARVTNVHDSIPRGTEVYLDISVAREEYEVLSRLVDRIIEAGVRVVYIKSGLLSHLAITLREAGLTVRSANVTVLGY